MKPRHACAFTFALLGLVACGDAGHSGESTASAQAASGADTATAAASAPVPSVTRTFGNWTAVCNNANDCWAYATAEDFGSGWVLLNYPAGPTGQVEVRVGDWSDTPGPLRLSIDGQAIGAATTQRSESGDGTMIDRFDDLAGLISRLAQGRTLAVRSADPESGAPSISLQGAAAAFLWIDERQGRLDSTTALVRRGDRPADSVPAAPALPVVRAAPAVSQAGLSDDPTLPDSLEALAQVKACRADMDWGNGTEVQKNDDVARLDGDTLLWSVLCARGAYNEGHRFFLTGNEGENPRPVLFRSSDQEAEDTGQDDDYILINAGYDPETRTVFSFSKGRGLGDCGAAYVWTWTGREFTPAEERVMQKCAGMWPDLWPTTWRSREG